MSTPVDRLSSALLGNYQIEREIGQGGMATVYLAQDLRHQRKVALKVLRPELSAILGGERFLHEIRTTANLQHPHIVPLHDSGESDGVVYYVMPYIEGESLRARLVREKQLAVEDAVRIAREVAEALDYAHRHGVVHRDIKPENILLHDGRAQVADFGIALAVSSAGGGTRMTETGMSLGTPHYMSPEQAMGEREISARSDIYALGCVLYEMLAGEPPFTGPTAQAIIARVVTEEPRSLVVQRRTIPPHLEAAVRKALEKLPADRFSSAAQFAAALANPELVALPAAARTGTGTAVSRAGPRAWLRSPRLAIVGLLTLLVLVTGAAAWGWLRGEPVAVSPAARFRLSLPENARFLADGSAMADSLLFIRGRQLADGITPDGRWLVYHENNASSTRNDIMLLSLDSARTTRPYLKTTADEFAPAVSPNGNWIAYSSDESGRVEVYVRAFPDPGGKIQISLDGGTEPRWSPTGRELYYRNGDRMMAAAVQYQPEFSVVSRAQLFRGSFGGNQFHAQYDVTRDGRVIMTQGPQASNDLVVVLNWFDQLRARRDIGAVRAAGH